MQKFNEKILENVQDDGGKRTISVLNAAVKATNEETLVKITEK